MRRADIEVPNLAGDVNSRARLACYPRGNFYPISHGPTTRNRRITLADFRPCSTRQSRSQAPLCQYTRRVISIHPEGTVARLRYNLGGDRPSQTAHQTRSARLHAREKDTIRRVVFQGCTPTGPQARLHRLPPILRIVGRPSMSSCSKAPRGLFVHLRVGRIFTATSISPSSSPRQCPDRYAIRAGRNLPDKEFRYLRTVIVTAAVHWGFGLGREARPLTFQHWAGVSPYTSGFPFAETCVFVKQSPGPARCGLSQPAGAKPGTATRRSFSRSYGAILPSSLARNHSSTWRYLPSPTCVGVRYGRWASSRPRVFLPEQAHANRFD